MTVYTSHWKYTSTFSTKQYGSYSITSDQEKTFHMVSSSYLDRNESGNIHPTIRNNITVALPPIGLIKEMLIFILTCCELSCFFHCYRHARFYFADWLFSNKKTLALPISSDNSVILLHIRTHSQLLYLISL